jgi:hypothetical protein
MTSDQPTHHGYAVDVKDRKLYWPDPLSQYENVTQTEIDALYEQRQADFWEQAAEIAREHGFRDVYSEGRMGGYAVPQPQPATDDLYPYELDAWVSERFRPFERDILALLDACREEFEADVSERDSENAREAMEAAYWRDRGVMTVG